MNLHDFLASVSTLDSTAKRWLFRTNNGTTDAYQEHLKQFDHPKSERDPAEILAVFDEYHGGAE